MKTIFSSALAAFLTAVFLLTRLSASEMPVYRHASVSADDNRWKTGPAALPPGAKMAMLEGDPTRRPLRGTLQFPDGYHVAPHTHPKTERVTVISGALYLATGEALDRIAKKDFP